jgi:hypothetical protein
MPEYCCTVRRFFASGWNRSRKDVRSRPGRLGIVFERDHGRQHVVAIVPARGAQPVLHAAAVAIDQQAAAALRILVIDDGHEGQRVRQRRDLERIGVEGVGMPAQMRRCAFQHRRDPAGVLGRDAPFAAVGFARRERRAGFLAGRDDVLERLDARKALGAVGLGELLQLADGRLGRGHRARFRRRQLEIIGLALDHVADALADQVRQRLAAGEIPMRAGPGQHLAGRRRRLPAAPADRGRNRRSAVARCRRRTDPAPRNAGTSPR